MPTDAPKELRSTCPIAAALDILGDRWTLVILRDVLFGERYQFSQMGSDERIASNVLTERLERLEREGLLEKRRDPFDGRRNIYLPLQRAFELIPLLVDLAVWGRTHTSATGASEVVRMAKKDRDAIIARLTSRAISAAKLERES